MELVTLIYESFEPSMQIPLQLPGVYLEIELNVSSNTKNQYSDLKALLQIA